MGSLVELLLARQGIGELSLLIPTLAQSSQQGKDIFWIAPPYQPYAPALHAGGIKLERFCWISTENTHEQLWAMEQVLAASAIAVLWRSHIQDKALRRLQLAAERGQTLGFLYRHSKYRQQPSAAHLRLLLDTEGHNGLLQLNLLKYRKRSVNILPIKA